MMILFTLVAWFFQSGYIVKNNGEVVQLDQIEIFQEDGSDATSVDFLKFKENRKTKKIEISRLKRINLKEPLSRSKGVTSWLVVLVEKNNLKREVVIDLVGVKGINREGDEEVISANVINKITF